MAPGPSLLRHFHVGVEGLSIHVAEGGAEDKAGLLFLHGWPQDWSAFDGVMALLQDDARVAAIDLPGIGLSDRPAPSSDKRTLAYYIHGVIESLGLRDVTLVGHDVGAQIVFAYLHAFPGALRGAVMVSALVPGIDPWQKLIRTPAMWHVGLHAVPALPEALVSAHRLSYFNYFFDRLAGPTGVDPRARARYAAAYARPVALRTGFEWFRAFARDERDHQAARSHKISTPTLYVQGERETGDVAERVGGLRDAGGLADVQGAAIPNCGAYAPDEQPEALAGLLRQFIGADVPHASAV